MEGARCRGRRPADRRDVPLEACRAALQDDAPRVFRTLKNPWAIGDSPALTQTSGWAGAWVSAPSAYAVRAHGGRRRRRRQLRARPSPAAGREGRRPRYQGTSNAPDSLLIWTRPMDRIELHDAFMPQGCTAAPQPAVSLGAGAVWLHAYDAVTKAGRYVQGGGCTDRRRRRPGPERRLRQLLQALRHWRRPACSRPRSSPPTAWCASPTPAPTRTCSGR